MLWVCLEIRIGIIGDLTGKLNHFLMRMDLTSMGMTKTGTTNRDTTNRGMTNGDLIKKGFID